MSKIIGYDPVRNPKFLALGLVAVAVYTVKSRRVCAVLGDRVPALGLGARFGHRTELRFRAWSSAASAEGYISKGI